jgi:hypothetical protein
MKFKIALIVPKAIYVVCIFMVAIVSLLLILDLILAPISAEILVDPSRRDWCGFFSRCASGTRQSFLEYLWSDAPWRRLHIIAIERRAELAAILGLLIGIGFMGLLFFSSQRQRTDLKINDRE